MADRQVIEHGAEVNACGAVEGKRSSSAIGSAGLSPATVTRLEAVAA